VPPLLLAGAPYLPLLRGLPRRVVKHGLGPCLSWPALWRWGRWLTHPLTAWLAFVVTSTAWHVPALYELTLRSPGWHAVEHLCFVATALLFWWPVLQPWPSRPQGPRWVLIPYLFLADVQNTILAAFLTFCERVLYPTYATAPRLTALTALDDQAAAGAMMWVLGSVAFLIPAGCITIQVLQGPRVAVRPVAGGVGASHATAARQRRRTRDDGRYDALRRPGGDSDARHEATPMRHETGRAWLRRTLLLVVALVAQVVTTHVHGGRVQLHQAADPFVVTVFTAPTPLHAGPVDISVLAWCTCPRRGNGSWRWPSRRGRTPPVYAGRCRPPHPDRLYSPPGAACRCSWSQPRCSPCTSG
jgi:Cytochrome c oxidase caa3 assembly factor (Caa3_CtaG)